MLYDVRANIEGERGDWSEKQKKLADEAAELEKRFRQLQTDAEAAQTLKDEMQEQAKRKSEKMVELENEKEKWKLACEQAQAETGGLQKRLAEAQQLKNGFVEVEG